jgi:hypothetical protein
MSFSNTTENDLLAKIFNNTAISWDGISNLFLSLHTADPGETGTQTTNEATYTGYARVSVSRTSGGWTVSGNTATNTALVQFPQCTGGTNTITHVAIGTATSGAGQIIISGALNSSLAVSNLITPQFGASQLSLSMD